MEQEKRSLRLVDHEGVDRLNNLDLFLRAAENEAVEIDVSGKDMIPTPVLQTIISAAHHWAQRDQPFTIVGHNEALVANLEQIGAELGPFFSEAAK